MQKESAQRRSSGAILYLGTERVEALAVSASEVDEHRAKDFAEDSSSVNRAKLASLVLEEVGARGRPCQLLLTDEAVMHRVVSMPPLAPAELRRVLQRKAANLLERPEVETQFAAFPLWNGFEPGPTVEQRWLVVALHRPSLVALRQELLRSGITVGETSWERLACLGALDSEDAAEPKATLLVGVEPESIGLILMYGPELVHLTTLKGNLHGHPGMASALIQEARGLEAHWRKMSRGKELEEVLLVGVEAATRSALEPGLHAALRGVTVRHVDPVGGRAHAEVLAAARKRSRYRFDLSVALPRRKSVLVTSMLVAGALGVLVGIGQYRRLSARAEGWALQAAALSARPAAAEEINRGYERIVTSLATFEKERDRVLAVGTQGIPMQEVLSEALQAFQGHGTLMSLSCDAVELGQGVVINGTTVAEPSASLLALEALVERLESTPAYSEVILTPPSSIAEASESGAVASLEFAIRAKWRGDS